MEDKKLIIEGTAPGDYNFKITLDIDDFSFRCDEYGWHYAFSYEISGPLADFTNKTHGYARIYRIEEDSQFTSNSSTHGVFIANFISKELMYWPDFAIKYDIVARLEAYCIANNVSATAITYGGLFEGSEDGPYVIFYHFLHGDCVRYIAILSCDSFHYNVKIRLLTTDDVINFLCDYSMHESEYTFIP